jgi:P27 family predicted phage terminase small subunit
MKPNAPKPPAHLSAASKRWFRQVLDAFVLEDHHVLLLVQACESIDRAESARRRLAKDGMFSVDRYGGTKPHPAIAVERAARAAFAKHLRELGLDVSTASEARRPPVVHGPRGGLRVS